MKYLILIILFSAGCAKPNYQGIVGVNPQNSERVYDLKFTKSGFATVLVFDETPATGKANSLSMYFSTTNSPDVILPKQDVAVSLWMPSMGHGSSPVKISIDANNVFRITEVYFIMPGDWQIVIQLKNKQTGQVEEEVRQNIIRI